MCFLAAMQDCDDVGFDKVIAEEPQLQINCSNLLVEGNSGCCGPVRFSQSVCSWEHLTH